MTTREVVAKTLIDEHADFLRGSVEMIAAEIMEAEDEGGSYLTPRPCAKAVQGYWVLGFHAENLSILSGRVRGRFRRDGNPWRDLAARTLRLLLVACAFQGWARTRPA